MHYLGVDTGGTFTDFVALNARTGAVATFKLPSVPEDPARAVLAGVERLRDRHGVDPSRIGRFHLRDHGGDECGARAQGRQDRPCRDQGPARRHRDPAPLAQPPLRPLHPEAAAVGASALALRGGRAHRCPGRGRDPPLMTDEEAERIAGLIAEGGFEAVAVCGLFSFLNPAHERRLRDAICAASPDTLVSISSDVSPEFREYERATTTVHERLCDAADRPSGKAVGNAARRGRLRPVRSASCSPTGG